MNRQAPEMFRNRSPHSPVYLRDLAADKQEPEFIGKNITELKKKAKQLGRDVIVGYYLDEAVLED